MKIKECKNPNCQGGVVYVELLRKYIICPECRKIAGKLLKEFRLNTLQLGLIRFAKFLGVKPSQVCNIEHGRMPNETPEMLKIPTT